MFTGIITDTAAVKDVAKRADGVTLTIARPPAWSDLTLGESVATNGVCLTVSALSDQDYQCHLVPETLAKSAFGQAIPGAVNLERALRLSDRLSGHLVQGHVDGTGIVTAIPAGNAPVLAVEIDQQFADLVIPKGSITINGVSLTIAELAVPTITVALVPHTLEHTTLGTVKAGEAVNLEFDMVGKYIKQLAQEVA